jgi:predicted acylesterase/phospholipase RssA
MNGSNAAERLLVFTDKNKCLPPGYSDPDRLLDLVDRSIAAGQFIPASRVLEWVKPWVKPSIAADAAARAARLDRLIDVAGRMTAADQYAAALDLLEWVEPEIGASAGSGPLRERLDGVRLLGQQGLELARIKALNPLVEAEGKELLAKAEEIFQATATGGKIPSRFATVDALLTLALKRKAMLAFSHARRLLLLAVRDLPKSRSHARAPKLIEQLALCTSTDPDLPADERFDAAFGTLRKLAKPGTIDDFSGTPDPCETYGIAGAIFKYKWNFDGNRRNLERSLGYYQKGYQTRRIRSGRETDWTYPGINAAFILDQLAWLIESETPDNALSPDSAATEHRLQADEIRRQVADEMNEQIASGGRSDWWAYATIAEADFGLGRYPAALDVLKTGFEIHHATLPMWEMDSTARQLSALNRLRPAPAGDGGIIGPIEVLEKGLGMTREAAGSMLQGKVGLALSGGGFRASLYHIGVLARLAEVDLLRDIEVISCVSGGSIVGAYYYLKLREVLRNKPDHALTAADYSEVVAQVAGEFLACVRKNIRTRMFSQPLLNLRMLIDERYTRTRRIAELFDSEIYADCVPHPQGRETPWKMSELIVRPAGQPEDRPFQPKFENWRRKAKVPILVLNATTLNTGHGWQFTATYMGEPPGNLVTEVDSIDRLRRVYYKDLEPRFSDLTLGTAVAASAGVPVIFTPVEIDGLYPGMTVRLADGGVYDNQGAMTLLEQGCDVLLVSDACGQLTLEEKPGWTMPSVAMRANDILMERVRGAQFRHLSALKRSGVLRALMVVHLKKGLETRPINWDKCRDAYAVAKKDRLTAYAVRQDIQAMLAAIRTDLDAFGNREAYALMASGYRMTKRYLRKSLSGILPVEPKLSLLGRFRAIFRPMAAPAPAPPQTDPLRTMLEVGRYRFLKLWRLDGTFGGLKMVAAGIAWATFVLLVWVWWSNPAVHVGRVALWILSAVLPAILLSVAPWAGPVVRLGQNLWNLYSNAVVATIGSFAVNRQLDKIDPEYLKRGEL